MPDTKISALPTTADVKNADVTVVVQGGADFKVPRSQLLTAGTGEDIEVKGAPAHSAALIADGGDAFYQLDDSGHGEVFALNTFELGTSTGASAALFTQSTAGTTFLFTDGTFFIVSNNGGTSGTFSISDAPNNCVIQGFTSVIVQFTGSAVPWQISAPADLATAIDRLAAAVNGLLGGGGIP
jgi:hypothetical protein